MAVSLTPALSQRARGRWSALRATFIVAFAAVGKWHPPAAVGATRSILVSLVSLTGQDVLGFSPTTTRADA